MKKISLAVVCILLTACFSLSCSQRSNDISITVSDSDHYYKIITRYDKSRSLKIDKYLNRHLGKGNISFINTHIDARLTLDDGTRFYMKKSPGYLSIKFNKDENTPTSLDEIKSIGEELKSIVTQ